MKVPTITPEPSTAKVAKVPVIAPEPAKATAKAAPPQQRALELAQELEPLRKTAKAEPPKQKKMEKTRVINLGGGVNLEMVLIPAGTFMIGSPESEEGRGTNETLH